MPGEGFGGWQRGSGGVEEGYGGMLVGGSLWSVLHLHRPSSPVPTGAYAFHIPSQTHPQLPPAPPERPATRCHSPHGPARPSAAIHT